MAKVRRQKDMTWQYGKRKLTRREIDELEVALKPLNDWRKKYDDATDDDGYLAVFHRDGQWSLNNSTDKGRRYFSISVEDKGIEGEEWTCFPIIID